MIAPSSLLARPPTLQVVGGQHGNLGFEFLYNWTVVNNDATTQTLTVTDANGTPSVYTIVAGASALFKKVPTQTYSLSGTLVGATASWPTEADPTAVLVPGPVTVSVSNTVKTDFGQSPIPAGLATNSVLTLGGIEGVKVLGTDPGQGQYGVAFAGGTQAPTTGVWRFSWKVGSAGTVIKVNGNVIENIGSVTPGDIAILEYPVIKGTTYTVTDDGTGGSLVDGVILAG